MNFPFSGLGIGTTPSALVAHGVRTTVVEIDPVVHEFATRYFRLPSNHTSVIQDATAFVIHYRHDARYDYIIHDVFTGGAEPINLFTVEFLNGLKDMLDEQGVIAIVRDSEEDRKRHRLMHTELRGRPSAPVC